MFCAVRRSNGSNAISAAFSSDFEFDVRQKCQARKFFLDRQQLAEKNQIQKDSLCDSAVQGIIRHFQIQFSSVF